MIESLKARPLVLPAPSAAVGPDRMRQFVPIRGEDTGYSKPSRLTTELQLRPERSPGKMLG
jgi:hypothetical protein